MSDVNEQLLERIRELEEQNRQLMSVLVAHNIPFEFTSVRVQETESPSAEDQNPKQTDADPAIVTRNSPMTDKIGLFMSLFHGRTEVYARQWKKDDRIAYSPVCTNRWNPALCKKPKVKCAECQCTAYQPLTGAVIEKHLSGQQVVGIYTILPGDLCYFLAVDFDEENWRDDVSTVQQVCESEQIPCSVEISRSGNGAHLWFFFQDTENAADARHFGSALLDRAMRNRAQLSFKSCDRMFPNQDTMPKGGIGNLIALPLQREAARTTGGSLFVDRNFHPYPDQWAYLSGVQRINHEELMRIAGSAISVETAEAAKPWERSAPLSSDDIHGDIKAVCSDRLYVECKCLSEKAQTALKRICAFRNPVFYKQQAMRMPIWQTPRNICCAEFVDGYLAMPRGCQSQIDDLFHDTGTKIVWQDKREEGKSIRVSFRGTLREEQSSALTALLPHDNGILSATTAFGKTVVGAALIAEKKVNTLVLVNRTQLVGQWKERLNQFLLIDEELPEQPKGRGRRKKREIIGQYGAGKDTRSGLIDIAVMQSLIGKDETPAWIREYGMIIVDECHHVPAFTFEQVMKSIPARYTYGLTATPKRADGHQPILNMYLGPIRYQVDALTQAIMSPFAHLMVPRFTGGEYTAENNSSIGIAAIYNRIAEDELRNAMIIEDVKTCAGEGRNCLILSERIGHIHALAESLRNISPNFFVLSGSAKLSEKREQLEALRNVSNDSPIVICATGKYIGEGFDEARLDTLFLTMPISWEGTLAQYVGRLHRLHDHKKEVRVYDYIDNNTEVLARMYQKRLKGYAAIGYQTAAMSVGKNKTDMIYSADECLEAFLADFAKAEKSIQIDSPYVANSLIRRMTDSIRDALKRRVTITVRCSDTKSFPENIQQSMVQAIQTLYDLGVTVHEIPHFFKRDAVLDHSIVWYGGISLLGHYGDESMLRIVSSRVARAIIGKQQESDGNSIATANEK